MQQDATCKRLNVYVKRVKNSGKTAQIVVSRTATGFVKRLFENEVPEIRQGLVQIKSVAREAGQRTKIAIYSEDPQIDPIGTCVGPKGVRVNAVVAELGGENSEDKFVSDGSYTIEDDIVNQIFAETDDEPEEEELVLDAGIEDLDFEEEDEE